MIYATFKQWFIDEHLEESSNLVEKHLEEKKKYCFRIEKGNIDYFNAVLEIQIVSESDLMSVPLNLDYWDLTAINYLITY